MKIHNEKEWERALAEIERLFDAEVGTPDAERLLELMAAVEEYEKEEFPWD